MIAVDESGPRPLDELRRAIELARHDDERALEEIATLRVVESRTERFVRRREKLVLHARERLGVRVPRYVVAEVDLNQVRLLPNDFP